MMRCKDCSHYKHERGVMSDLEPCNYVSRLTRKEKRLKVMVYLCYILGAGMIAFLIFG